MGDVGDSSEDESSEQSQEANEKPIAGRCVTTVPCIASEAVLSQTEAHCGAAHC